MSKIAKKIPEGKKFVCITLDFEEDYGDRVGNFNILDDSKGLEELKDVFVREKTPVSAFITTGLLLKYPKSFDCVRMLAQDYHGHSHTHNTRDSVSKKEIADTAETFEKFFGHRALGYRAPQGVLREGDIDLMKRHGFKFSSSVFPSYRPGKFNNLNMPPTPFLYDNGIMELPLAAVRGMRLTISLSYLKLLGFPFNQALYSVFGLPDILIFDSHLHDYLVSEKSFSRLPWELRVAWGNNKHAGIRYFRKFMALLRAKGYEFITMTDLYLMLSSEGRPGNSNGRKEL
ncbi:MAG: polysaccharide deacetylase family protein [Candidatus Omnitrophica bacterium]|nr:polysaccharide deacetylase family protein [Candidatus Omnitrophota bacterium]